MSKKDDKKYYFSDTGSILKNNTDDHTDNQTTDNVFETLLTPEKAPLNWHTGGNNPLLSFATSLPAPVMPKMEFVIGETCWIHADDYNDKCEPVLSEGRVIGYLDFEACPKRQYMIRMADPKYLHIECRDIDLMSDSPTRLPAFWPPILLRSKGVIASTLN